MAAPKKSAAKKPAAKKATRTRTRKPAPTTSPESAREAAELAAEEHRQAAAAAKAKAVADEHKANGKMFGRLDPARKKLMDEAENPRLFEPTPLAREDQLLEEAYVQHLAAEETTDPERRAALVDYESRLLVEAGVKAP